MPTLKEVRARVDEAAGRIREKTTEWAKTKPEGVQRLVAEYPPDVLYQTAPDAPICECHVALRDGLLSVYSYFEDGTHMKLVLLHAPSAPEDEGRILIVDPKWLRPVRITDDDAVVALQ